MLAVRREDEGKVRVERVEVFDGKLGKRMFSGLAEQLGARKARLVDSGSLREDFKRRILMNLRGFFERGGVLISSKYGNLIEDLRWFSYRKPSQGYVFALAVALDLCAS